MTSFPPPLVDQAEFRPGTTISTVADWSWTTLCKRIRMACPEAIEELYQRMQSRRLWFFPSLDQPEAEDRFHDAFVIVLENIQGGKIREPERMDGFIAVVVRRCICQGIVKRIRTRVLADETEAMNLTCPAMKPDEARLRNEQLQILRDALAALRERDREVIVRFYVHGQSRVEIMAAMNLTDTQFRLMKNRAKGRFIELGKRGFAKPLIGFSSIAVTERRLPAAEATPSRCRQAKWA